MDRSEYEILAKVLGRPGLSHRAANQVGILVTVLARLNIQVARAKAGELRPDQVIAADPDSVLLRLVAASDDLDATLMRFVETSDESGLLSELDQHLKRLLALWRELFGDAS